LLLAFGGLLMASGLARGNPDVSPTLGAGPPDRCGLPLPGTIAEPVSFDEEISVGESDQDRGYRPLSEVGTDVSLPTGLLPGDPEASGEAAPILRVDARLTQGWGLMEATWSPTNLCHRPLYFEQVNLERHGYTISPLLQPAISGAHFFATIPALPYKMTVDRPRDCIYTLGYYRPGSVAPRRWQGLPLHAGAATVEAATAIGLVLLLP
jgi:hypothetical protein